VLANPGLVDPSYSSLGLVAELRIFVGETEIFDLPGQWVLFENVHAGLSETQILSKRFSCRQLVMQRRHSGTWQRNSGI